jgi:hypothetical protein
LKAARSARGIAIGDYDGDGRPDISVVSKTESCRLFRNLGDLKFEDVSAAWSLDQKGVSFGAAFGDLGRDGSLDLVYGNYHALPAPLSATAARMLVDETTGSGTAKFPQRTSPRDEKSTGDHGLCNVCKPSKSL